MPGKESVSDVKNNEEMPLRYLWVFYFFALLTSPIPLYQGGVIGVLLWFLPVVFLGRFWRVNKITLYALLVFIFWVGVLLLGAVLSGTVMEIDPFGLGGRSAGG